VYCLTERMVIYVVTILIRIQARIGRWIAIQMHEEYTGNLLNFQSNQISGNRNEIGNLNVRHWSPILWADAPTIGPCWRVAFGTRLSSAVACPVGISCPAVLEAAAHEKKTEQTKKRAAENKISPPGSRSIEGRRNRAHAPKFRDIEARSVPAVAKSLKRSARHSAFT
jgi:hypothetical protein